MEQYNAITGEEFRLKVLKEIDKHLNDDNNFRRACTYHRLEWNWKISFKAFGQPAREATIQGAATADSPEAKLADLQEQVKIIKKQADDSLFRAKQDHANEIASLRAAFEKQIQEIRSTAAPVSVEVSSDIESAVSTLDDSPGVVEFSVSAEQSPIEEPGRVREDLENIGAGLENIVVGLSPSEVKVTDTEGKPTEAPRAARSAIVGRGQRPANVVGRPRG